MLRRCKDWLVLMAEALEGETFHNTSMAKWLCPCDSPIYGGQSAKREEDGLDKKPAEGTHRGTPFGTLEDIYGERYSRNHV